LAHGRANGDPTSAQLTAVGGVSVVNYGSEVCSKKFAILAIARQSVVIWESVCSTWPAHIIDAKISQSVTFLLDIVRFIGCGSAKPELAGLCVNPALFTRGRREY
jgi:hypothetical protein